jgi:hypothetical protein
MKNNPNKIIIHLGGNDNTININTTTKKEPSMMEKFVAMFTKLKKLLS